MKPLRAARQADKKESRDRGHKVVGTIYQAGPANGFLLARIFRSGAENRFAHAHCHELPVDEHRVLLKEEDQTDLVHADRHLAHRIGDLGDSMPETTRLGRSSASSSSVGGISDVDITEIMIETIEHTAPIQKAQ